MIYKMILFAVMRGVGLYVINTKVQNLIGTCRIQSNLMKLNAAC